MRDFREVFGLKITRTKVDEHTSNGLADRDLAPFIVYQQSAPAVIILLLALKEDAKSKELNFADHQQLRQFSEPISAMTPALEECFRCLLTTSMQVVLPRSIAQMLYQFAVQSKIPLSESITEMLSMTAETMWKSVDLAALSSDFKAFDLDGTARNARMEDLIRS